LLSRRLVEFGVPFVEVDMGGWDTHKDNFGRVKNLSAQLDQGMGGLIADLKQRGLLDSTLVVWMGDFGRTPDVKAGGRGHDPKAWTTILAGGGLKTGGCVGKTDERGATIVDRRVGVNDFLATICLAVGVDPTKDFNTRTGRPIRIVDKGEKPIIELLG
jgi:arylsulfatase A-like enzyme